MRRALRAALLILGLIALITVTGLAVEAERDANKHERSVQKAFDLGRIEGADFRDSAPEWQKGWN